MMHEIWLDIKGYEGMYQVSNMGRVRALPKTIHYGDGRVEHRGIRVLKNSVSRSKGYARVNLRKNGKASTLNVHRLVYTTFRDIEKEDCVNHINKNRLDNRLSNLRHFSNTNG